MSQATGTDNVLIHKTIGTMLPLHTAEASNTKNHVTTWIFLGILHE